MNNITENLELVNEKLDLLRQREDIVLAQLNKLKQNSKSPSDENSKPISGSFSNTNSKQIQNNIVSKNDLNKLPKNWPYAQYLNSFNSTSSGCLRLLIPTILIRLEIGDAIYGPFRAMLDTGAQPAIISATLYNSIRCPTSASSRRLIGIDARPFTIKRKFNACVRPWFDSEQRVSETMWFYQSPVYGIRSCRRRI